MNVLGVDPGQSGALAVVGDGRLWVEKMPETLQDLWVSIQGWAKDVDVAYLENVHTMPGQGVASSGKFMRQVGNLEAFLTAAGIPFERVTPTTWQKALGCLSKGDKNVTKRRAQELYPTIKVTHALADALLLATYGYRLQSRAVG